MIVFFGCPQLATKLASLVEHPRTLYTVATTRRHSEDWWPCGHGNGNAVDLRHTSLRKSPLSQDRIVPRVGVCLPSRSRITDRCTNWHDAARADSGAGRGVGNSVFDARCTWNEVDRGGD